MPKSKLKTALDRQKGRNYNLEKQRKLEKAAEKRKQAKRAEQEDEIEEEEDVDDDPQMLETGVQADEAAEWDTDDEEGVDEVAQVCTAAVRIEFIANAQLV